jgi:hypothetical protein
VCILDALVTPSQVSQKNTPLSGDSIKGLVSGGKLSVCILDGRVTLYLILKTIGVSGGKLGGGLRGSLEK